MGSPEMLFKAIENDDHFSINSILTHANLSDRIEILRQKPFVFLLNQTDGRRHIIPLFLHYNYCPIPCLMDLLDRKQIYLFKILLDYIIDEETLNILLISVFWERRFREHFELVLSHGADPNCMVKNLPIVFSCISEGEIDCVAALKKAGADMAIKNSDGLNPFEYMEALMI